MIVVREDTLMRFLVDDVTPDERARVERRLSDEKAFEELAALEESMMLSYLRGDLSPAWRDRFEACLRRSEATARRLQSLDAFRSAIAATAADAPRRTEPEKTRSSWQPVWPNWGMALAASAALVTVASGAWYVSRETVPSQPTTVSVAPTVTTPSVATFVLVPTLTRAAQESNSFRVPPGVEQVQLELTVPADGVTVLNATLRPVGGDLLSIGSVPEFRTNGGAVELRWMLPARQLPPGDYILDLRAKAPGEEQVSVAASTAFSIVE